MLVKVFFFVFIKVCIYIYDFIIHHLNMIKHSLMIYLYTDYMHTRIHNVAKLTACSNLRLKHRSGHTDAPVTHTTLFLCQLCTVSSNTSLCHQLCHLAPPIWGLSPSSASLHWTQTHITYIELKEKTKQNNFSWYDECKKNYPYEN